MNIKRDLYFKIERQGIVLEKFKIEAKKGGQFTNTQGQVVKYDDKPEKYYLNVATGESCTKERGYEGCVLMAFEVPEESVKDFNVFEKVNVVFKMKAGSGELIPDSIRNNVSGVISEIVAPTDKDAPAGKK